MPGGKAMKLSKKFPNKAFISFALIVSHLRVFWVTKCLQTSSMLSKNLSQPRCL